MVDARYSSDWRESWYTNSDPEARYSGSWLEAWYTESAPPAPTALLSMHAQEVWYTPLLGLETPDTPTFGAGSSFKGGVRRGQALGR